MAESPSDVWPEILTALEEELPARTVQNWFRSAIPEIQDTDPPTIDLTLPTSFHRSHIRDRYYSILRDACREAFQQDVTIQLHVSEEDEETDTTGKSGPHTSKNTPPNQAKRVGEKRDPVKKAASSQSAGERKAARQKQPQSPTATVKKTSSAQTPSAQASASVVPTRPEEFHRSSVRTELKDRYTFDTFVQGDSNALARSASTAVAEDPGGTNYNPLLIYGGVGLGKTHLAQAIANYSADKKTAEFICYASGEEFTSEFVQSIRDGKGNQFSKKYRGVDLLILDDIQFLEGKEKTQEEFFHLFNTLYQHNKQIVLCADRLPQKISGIEERVLSRFEWGLSTDVQQPSLETRLAILQMKADALNLEIEQEVLDLMAESITTNVRQLEGALKQLSARAKLMDVKVDIETARRLLKDQIRLSESSSPDPEDVLNAITSYYSSSREELTGQSRREELVYPRHVAMYFCRKLTSLSLSAIGARFGGRDHSTVSHACKKVSDRLDVNPQLEGELEDVKREIQSYAARS